MSELANETAVDAEMTFRIRSVTLRHFGYRLRPLPAPRQDGSAVNGIELELSTPDGMTVSARFDRSEFVQIATTALAMLDAADADTTEGREK